MTSKIQFDSNVWAALALAGGIVAVSCAIAFRPPSVDNGPDLREQRMQQQKELLGLNTALEAQQKEAAIAEARYKAGCIVVVSQVDPSKFTSLSIGKPVIDSSRNVPLSSGSVVCDWLGYTGEIVNGVVANMAWTGNKSVVEAAMQDIKATSTIPGQ